MQNTFYFKNADWQDNLSAMFDYVKNDLINSNINRYFTSESIYSFYHSFLSNLDHGKNFYFNNNNHPFLQKTLYLNTDGNSIPTKINKNYQLDSMCHQKAIASERRDNVLINQLMSNIGSLIADQVRKGCYGDSYVISDPTFYVNFTEYQTYQYSVRLRFNSCPELSECMFDNTHMHIHRSSLAVDIRNINLNTNGYII